MPMVLAELTSASLLCDSSSVAVSQGGPGSAEMRKWHPADEGHVSKTCSEAFVTLVKRLV